MTANPLLGAVLHAVGAAAAAFCFLPQQKLKGWSWQSYWLSQATVGWLIAPLVGAWLTIPHLSEVLQEAPRGAMLITFLLGAAYGIGGTAFGLAIRHLGYSLTYAIAIGLSCILGTLAGPILRGELGEIFGQVGAYWVMGGIGIGLFGTMLCGLAGRWKEIELSPEEQSSFNLPKGLMLSMVAGILSAVYGIAINDTAAPITKIAADHGAGHWQTNIAYVFANTGTFLTASLYALWLGKKEKTLHELTGSQGSSSIALLANYGLAALTGLLWYSQFLFYGLAHVRMGQFKFSSWAFHMTMLILFSSLAGVVMREWSNCQRRTRRAILGALAVLVGSVLMIAYGNYSAEQARASAEVTDSLKE